MSKIEGKIILDDGSESEFYIATGDLGGRPQWGVVTERLGRTVNLMELLAEALRQYDDEGEVSTF